MKLAFQYILCFVTQVLEKKHEKRVYSTLQPQFELGCDI